jgi:hypothetical protein
LEHPPPNQKKKKKQKKKIRKQKTEAISERGAKEVNFAREQPP